MATHEAKRSAPKAEVALSLEDEFRARGVDVPDQIDARRKKEAARLGISLQATDRQIRFSWIRRRRAAAWRIYAWHEFDGAAAKDRGGMPPKSVEVLQAKISSLGIPGLSHEVHAKIEDPWYVTSRETNGQKEEVIFAGWINGYRIF